MRFNKTHVGLLIVGLVVAGLIVWNGSPAETVNTSETQNAQVNEQTTEVTVQGIEGETALETLKANYNVETTEYTGVGEFVTGINGVVADGTTNFWGFYINNEMAQVGASSYVAKQGDTLTFKLEVIE